MKTASVQELSSFLTETAMPGRTGSAGAPKGESFSDIISSAVSGRAVSAADSGRNAADAGVKANTDGAAAKSSEGRSADSVNENGKPADRSETKKTDDVKVKDPDRKETDDKLEAAGKEVVSKLKEELGVSDEEIEEAMEILGLTVADLLDPAALTQLFVEVSGAQDTMSILTDETLGTQLQEVLGTLETLTDRLKEQLGITDEELKQAVRAFDVSKDSSVAETVADEEKIVPLESEEEIEAPTDEKEQVLTVSKEEDAGRAQTGEGELTEEKVTTAGRSQQTEKKGSEAKSSDNGQLAGQGAQDVRSFDGEILTEEIPGGTARYTSAETQEIARQLVEQIKVNVSAETTSLDMVLNPASLGHVALNIEARNGVITAAFTAQNESVRAIIESQMITLRENLEQQGVKIEAVEVTVASHAFDENLQRGSQQDERRDEAGRALGASGRRMRINLLGDEAEEEELTEEEEINKDMMIRNGNTMDVTA